MRFVVQPAPFRRASRVLAAAGTLLIALSAGAVAPALARDSASGPAAVTITIRAGLSDRDVRISAGEIVRFVNRDGERHRMRSRSGSDGFDTGDLEPGEAYQVRLTEAGTYTYLDERDDDAAAYRGRIVVVSSGDAGSGGSTGGATGGQTPPPGGSAGGSTGGGTDGSVASSATVTIGDDFFQPTSVRIATGGTATFRNTGGDEHSATSSAFDTGVLGGGASARKTFTTAGTFSFLCIFHSDMRGTIEVVAPAGGGTTEPEAARPTPTPAPTAVPAPTVEPAAQIAGAASAVSVDAADFAFRPATVEVAAGGRVTWTNQGVAPHTVTAKDGSFDSGMLEAGAAFAEVFETPGSYAYLCAFHPEMIATIRVVAPSIGRGSGRDVANGRPAAPVAGGPAAGGAAAAGDANPSAAPSGQPALASGTARTGAASPPVEAPTATVTTDAEPATGLSSLGGLVLAITLVSAAAALFSRAIRGTVRMPE